MRTQWITLRISQVHQPGTLTRPASRRLRTPTSPGCSPPAEPATSPSWSDPPRKTIQQALARVQERHSTWTRADLLRQLAVAMPTQTRAMAPEAAVALLHELADAALAGQVEQVACLDAPEWPPLPDYLRRDLDGRSVYTRPGTTRYATRVQLTREERLVQTAQRRGAPHLARVHAASLLHADPAVLGAALRGDKPRTRNATQPSAARLRADQAAAIYHALTSDRLAEILVGPAGSGKTRVLAEAARAWTRAGLGPVIGITTTQAARNVLAAAGVPVAVNSSAFLGHLPGRRGALGARDLGRGTLLLIDEASMMSMTDLAEIVALAARCGAKVLIAGDPEQLAAIENGGGMSLLASRLGSVQLTEAVRFTHAWEREASLRLRVGDASALDDYQQHGRIRGAEPGQAMDDAARSYVAHHLAGTDVLLMIGDRARCRETSRRIRDDLIHLGLVDGGRDVGLADGARASAGDLIICRENDHDLPAGQPDRTLANGDTLRIESVRGDTVLVRRALDCDPVTGARRWSDHPFAFADLGNADLAYAVTGHSAQGRTVRVAMSLLTGGEDRHWLYVAATRGAEQNVMFACTQPRVADPEAGTRPAPELARHERITRERLALPAEPAPSSAPVVPEPREAIAIPADILSGSKNTQASATQARDRSLSDADHLATLNAIWHGETTKLQASRYRQIVLAELPAQYAGEDLTSPQATWLWRTLRAAEAAGLDARELTRQVIAARSLSGARDVAAVLDSRLRKLTDSLVPQPPPPWSQRVPETADPEQHRYLTDLAAAMDARKERLGEHLAEHPPAWALRTLGPVPEHPLDRLDWQRRAADVGGYRELYGYVHPDQPVGPEPSGDSPAKRAAWHAAFAALGPVNGLDLRGLPDGSLLELRAAYPTETAWAPRHVGRELAHIRASADDASLRVIRARAEEAIAGQRGQADVAGRHGLLARSWTAMATFYRQQETELEQTMAVRRDWEAATAETRSLAVAADTELRRRQPGRRLDPLRSAEPVVTEADREQLALVPGEVTYETPEWVSALADERRAVQQRLSEREAGDSLPGYVAELRPVWADARRDAVLQPPKPEIRPAGTVLERAAEVEAEAGR
jgi:AAA domain